MAQLSGEIRGGNKPFRFDKDPGGSKNDIKNTQKKMFNPPKPKANKPKSSYNGAEYGSATGGKYNPKNNNSSGKKYTQTKATHYGSGKKNTSGGSSSGKKNSGGAYGAGGKYYKNGYVDSKGNKVVNGKWVSPAKQGNSGSSRNRTSGGSSGKASKPKANKTVAKPQVARTAAPAPEPEKPKTYEKLAEDYFDKVYYSQIGAIDDAEKRFDSDIGTKAATSSRNHLANTGDVQLNETNSLQNSAEDYASRGMMRSGAYQTNIAETQKIFRDQLARMAANQKDEQTGFTNAKAEMDASSNLQRNEEIRKQAQRNALENERRAAAAGAGAIGITAKK